MRLNRTNRYLIAAAVGVLAAGGMTAQAMQSTRPAAPTTPATQPGQVEQPAGRNPQAIVMDLQTTGQQLSAVLDDESKVLTAEGRATVKDQAVPLLEKMRGLAIEMQAIAPGQISPSEFETMLVLFGDEPTVQRLTTEAEGTGPAAETAQMSLTTGRYIAAEDEAARGAQIDALTEAAEANPQSQAVTQAVAQLVMFPTNTPQQTEQLTAILSDSLQNPMAGAIAEQLKAQSAAQGAMDGIVGTEIELAGPDATGEGTISLADYKGKVVLIDFWATWCGPCIAELPKMTEVYAKHQGDDFEIIGVSLDQGSAPLTQFLAENPKMSWPQIFNPDNPGELADKFGVQAIPTMFLVDKQGVVRSVTARQDYETLIPQLLAE
jgi:thiol-disulfide isomerase/thioredoxin